MKSDPESDVDYALITVAKIIHEVQTVKYSNSLVFCYRKFQDATCKSSYVLPISFTQADPIIIKCKWSNCNLKKTKKSIVCLSVQAS